MLNAGLPLRDGAALSSTAVLPAPLQMYSHHVVHRPSETLKSGVPFSPFPLLKMEMRTSVLLPFVHMFFLMLVRIFGMRSHFYFGAGSLKAKASIYLDYFINSKYADILSS